VVAQQRMEAIRAEMAYRRNPGRKKDQVMKGVKQIKAD